MGHTPELDDIQALIKLIQGEDAPGFMSTARRVFCNRNLNMQGVEWIGFDMDYTLAQYHQEALDALSHRLTLERLHTVKGYPEAILTIEPRPEFAIRGLVIDKHKGHIFKMDAHRHVGKSYHGFEPVSSDDLQDYIRKPVRFTDRYHLVDTLFALPEAFLFAALVDFFERHPEDAPFGGWRELFDDIRFCIDLAHRDNSIKDAILDDMAAYVMPDPELAITLHKFRSSGKRIFLLTNSYWRYSTAVMRFLLDGQLSHYPSWRNYFDVIITGAQKPFFFSGDNPFLRLEDDGTVTGEARERFERGRLYQAGNLRDFERMIDAGGPTILYVGDHIYGDILKSKKTSSWRTCMIVQEMEEELRKSDEVRREISQRNALDNELHRLNDEIFFMSSLERRFDAFIDELADASDAELMTAARKDLRHSTERLKRRRKAIIQEINELSGEIEGIFNPYWGLLYNEGNETSIFGKQLQDYACLYTSRVSNLCNYSPLHHYRAPTDRLPHEL